MQETLCLDDACGPNYYPNVRLVHYLDGSLRMCTRVAGRKVSYLERKQPCDAMTLRLMLGRLDQFVLEQPLSEFKPGFEIRFPNPDTERLVYHEYAGY